MSGSDALHSNLCKLAIALSLSLPQLALADETIWPQLEGSASERNICAETLEIAKAVYLSDNLYLYQLPTIPQSVGATLVLKPSALDISDGDALVADPSTFQKIPKTDSDGNAPRSLYWQVKAQHGLRYVINEDSFGWRGDQYTLFALKADVTSDTFLRAYSRDRQEQAFTPLIQEGWRPPLMLQETGSGNLFAIDVGAPYAFLGDWHVYSIGADGAKPRCTVHFHPQAETATSLLPAPVRKLAALLDGTLGSGEGEGTLQETARLKTEIMHSWANVAMRPWAVLKAQPYNSRAQVDAELRKWSHKAKSFRALYNRINAQYPKAERSLAEYYRAGFHKKSGEAKALARQALDVAMRMYFVFPQ